MDAEAGQKQLDMVQFLFCPRLSDLWHPIQHGLRALRCCSAHSSMADIRGGNLALCWRAPCSVLLVIEEWSCHLSLTYRPDSRSHSSTGFPWESPGSPIKGLSALLDSPRTGWIFITLHLATCRAAFAFICIVCNRQVKGLGVFDYKSSLQNQK